jgi:hypothetical protein
LKYEQTAVESAEEDDELEEDEVVVKKPPKVTFMLRSRSSLSFLKRIMNRLLNTLGEKLQRILLLLWPPLHL